MLLRLRCKNPHSSDAFGYYVIVVILFILATALQCQCDFIKFRVDDKPVSVHLCNLPVRALRKILKELLVHNEC